MLVPWFGCGNSLRKLQRYDEAIASYERALELQPEFHWAWCHKARCHALKNDRDLAIESLTQAIKSISISVLTSLRYRSVQQLLIPVQIRAFYDFSCTPIDCPECSN
ncbi:MULTISPECIES: tetratricopeptide repeat protein [unclassified Nostoc]|uniref:tetratricopeptide repeat protein n=1 Tax=Nostoc sp. NMS2 TaxID=2815389 RepID=UPI0025DADE00|nr:MULTISPECIES: tetratricopeptide repeat protein [unclassified Nostoc]